MGADGLKGNEMQYAEVDETDRAGEYGMSRREFLTYAWLSSLAFAGLGFTAVLYRFALPRLEPGQLGSTVDMGPVDGLPAAGEEPLPFKASGFWWVMTDEGALALYKVCTHLGCLYDWKPTEGRFICPCHGSQFARDGTYIKGPAPRSLDRFAITVVDDNGNEVARTDEEGGPTPAPRESRATVDTGDRILGRAQG